MLSSRVSFSEPSNATPVSATEETGVPRRRARLASALLFMAVVAALAAGGWGLISSLGTQAPPARVGEAVEVPGGFLRVDGVTPEHMAPMQSNKFAASGMSMASMGMDMAPEGQRRFLVNVTLASERGDLGYSANDFRISGEGIKESQPIRHQLATGTVPEGSAVSGNLVFQVPEEAKGLMLSFDEGRPVALDLPPASEEGGHSHSGAGQPKSGGHSHGD